MYAYNDTMSIRGAMQKYKGEFTGDLFETLLTGKVFIKFQDGGEQYLELADHEHKYVYTNNLESLVSGSDEVDKICSCSPPTDKGSPWISIVHDYPRQSCFDPLTMLQGCDPTHYTERRLTQMFHADGKSETIHENWRTDQNRKDMHAWAGITHWESWLDW